MIKLRGVKAYANTQIARQATDVAFSGFMQKQGGKGVAKWQQRYIRLMVNGEVQWYKDSKTNHPQGQLRLNGPSVRMKPVKGYQWCFEFTDNAGVYNARGKGPLILAVEHDRDYQQWMAALKPWMGA